MGTSLSALLIFIGGKARADVTNKFAQLSYSRKSIPTFVASYISDAVRLRIDRSSFKYPEPQRRSVCSEHGWVRIGKPLGSEANYNDTLKWMSRAASPPGPRMLPPPQGCTFKTARASTNDPVEYPATLVGGALRGAVPDAAVSERICFQKSIDTEGDGRPDASNGTGIIDTKPITPLRLMASGDDSFGPRLFDNNSNAKDISRPASRCRAFAKTQTSDKHHLARSLPHACPDACGGRCS
jgi:hypothetical protein